VHQWIEENKVKSTWLDALELFEDEYAAYLHKHLSSNISFEEWFGLAHPEVEIID
jgi:hypothetical protein